MHELEVWPGGPRYERPERTYFSYDDPLVVEAYRDHPQWARVEFGAQWDTVQDRYLDDEPIERLFSSYPELGLPTVHQCRPDCRHFVHVDTSKVNANTVIVVGHAHVIDGETHVVIDEIWVLRPGDFADGHIDYRKLEELLREILDRYRCTELTFDGYESLYLIQNLREHVRASGHKSRACRIDDASTSADRIWHVWETTKVALNAGVVHAAYHDLLYQELRFLFVHNQRVECPTSGPVKTKDASIAFAHVVNAIRDQAPPPDFPLPTMDPPRSPP